MANDFSGDSNCIAVWNFESGALTTDSQGTNTLTDINTVGEETVDYKQGACCADLEYDNNEHFQILNADLDSGFPLKSGESNLSISIVFWTKLESLALDWYPYFKGHTADDDFSFGIKIESSTGNKKIEVWIGYNGGSSWETYRFDAMDELALATWYHVGVTYNSSTKTAHLRIWDDGASENHYDGTHVYTESIVADSGRLVIGGYQGITRYDGLVDEMAIFNDVLSSSEIDQIRAGTYGAAGNAMPMAMIGPLGGRIGGPLQNGS